MHEAGGVEDRRRLAVLTLTAPGRNVLPHGPDGKVERQAADEWNGSMPARWRDLNRQAHAHAKRRCGVRRRMLMRQIEPQGRGVWHLHVALPYSTNLDRRYVHAYNDALRALGARYGFGFNDRNFPTMPAWRAARYLSKYFSDGAGAKGKQSLRAWVESGALLPPIPSYIARDLTRATGCTMRALRRRRYVYCLVRAGDALELPDGLVVARDTGEVLADAPFAPRGP